MEDILVIESNGNIELYTEPISYNDSVPDLDRNDTVQVQEQEQPISEIEEEEVEEEEEVVEVEENADIKEIKEILKGLQENENNDNDEFNDVLDVVSDNVVSVSGNNIITTQISDYTISESLTLLLFLSVLVAGMVYVIHKSIYHFT